VSVALVEGERTGGACVNFACIPTNILLGSATAYLEAREQDVLGVFSAGDQFNLGRAVARKDALVQQLSRGVETMLRGQGIEIVRGRASFAGAHALDITLQEGGAATIDAGAVVIATGSRWEPEPIPG
jgi:dihydrolipoamide dehydrogenase